MAEFSDAWSGMDRQWVASLNGFEREKLESLPTEQQRDAFRIIRNWSRDDSAASDFFINAEALARRLGLTIRGASKMRDAFCKAGILHKTAPCVPHKRSARFIWMPGSGDGPARSRVHVSTRPVPS